MKNRLLPVALVLAPAVLGLLARGAEFATANGALTVSAGRVAPQEIASTLAAGDLALALGLSLSLALALVWIGSGVREGARTWAPRALVAAGLLVATLGTLRLQALNAALAEDYRATVAAAWTQPEEQALEQAEPTTARPTPTSAPSTPRSNSPASSPAARAPSTARARAASWACCSPWPRSRRPCDGVPAARRPTRPEESPGGGPRPARSVNPRQRCR